MNLSTGEDIWYSEETDENGEVIGLLNFSDKAISELGWNTDDIIEFVVDGNTIIMKKAEDP